MRGLLLLALLAGAASAQTQDWAHVVVRASSLIVGLGGPGSATDVSITYRYAPAVTFTPTVINLTAVVSDPRLNATLSPSTVFVAVQPTGGTEEEHTTLSVSAQRRAGSDEPAWVAVEAFAGANGNLPPAVNTTRVHVTYQPYDPPRANEMFQGQGPPVQPAPPPRSTPAPAAELLLALGVVGFVLAARRP